MPFPEKQGRGEATVERCEEEHRNVETAQPVPGESILKPLAEADRVLGSESA